MLTAAIDDAMLHVCDHPHYILLSSLLSCQAYDKDESERSELAAIRARFNVAIPIVDITTSVDDSWMDDAPSIKVNPTSSVKFSQTKRNKLAVKASNKAKAQAAIDEKQLAKFVNRLPVLLSELKKEDKHLAKERVRIEGLKETNPDHKPKLGRYQEEVLFPEVALTEELPVDGSFRALKPSTHMVKDQFNRFQQRHLIETRKKVKAHKGNKVRSYQRYKD
jgi:hypothetical protein